VNQHISISQTRDKETKTKTRQESKRELHRGFHLPGRSASFGAIRSLMTDCNKYETQRSLHGRGGMKKGGDYRVRSRVLRLGAVVRERDKKTKYIGRDATLGCNPGVCVCVLFFSWYNVWMG
jgi:hypothetical protein